MKRADLVVYANGRPPENSEQF